MKYMTFNSSCSYAGVANMLERYEINVEDRDIALGMNLPFLFAKENMTYLAGPMLQSGDWFNIYLQTVGYRLVEDCVTKSDIPTVLKKYDTAMIGIRVSPNDKHAVVFAGCKDGRYALINNKWQHTHETEILELTETELLERLDEQVVVAHLSCAEASSPDFKPLFEASKGVLADLSRDIANFCAVRRTAADIASAMKSLFRPILLDGVTMLELLGNETLAQKLRVIRSEFVEAVKQKSDLVLADAIDVQMLKEAIADYSELIEKRMNAE